MLLLPGLEPLKLTGFLGSLGDRSSVIVVAVVPGVVRQHCIKRRNGFPTVNKAKMREIDRAFYSCVVSKCPIR